MAPSGDDCAERFPLTCGPRFLPNLRGPSGDPALALSDPHGEVAAEAGPVLPVIPVVGDVRDLRPVAEHLRLLALQSPAASESRRISAFIG